MRTIIGLTGYAGSGKDEAAKALIEQRGFVRIGFADILKEVAYKLNPIIGFTPIASYIRLVDAVDTLGWDDAKRESPEIRSLLQRLGTEAGREVFGESFWIDRAMDRINKLPHYQAVVITDVRFPNEAAALRFYGGKIVRIIRNGVGAVNGHISDQGINDIGVDHVIANDWTIADLHHRIIEYHDTHDKNGCRFYVEEPEQRLLPFDHTVSQATAKAVAGDDWGKDNA